MFGKLKEKLKGALSIFSKKTQEEVAEKEEVSIPKQKEVKKIPKEEKKQTKAKVKDKTGKKIVEKKKKEKKREENVEKEEIEVIKEPILSEEKVEVIEEKPIVLESPKEEVEEKRGFFQKLKDKFQRKEEVIVKEEKTEAKVQEKVVLEEKKEERSFLTKVKESFTTKTISAAKFEELFWDLEVILLESNVALEVIEKIKEDLKKELVEKPIPRDVSSKIEETLTKTLKEILDLGKINLLERIQTKKPYIITFFGINGAGKTTTIAKLAHYLQKNNVSVVLAACDTFRAAAIQQLEEHAKKLDIKIIKQNYGADAAAVAFDAIKFAQKNNIDVVLIDTAGRLHSNANLMSELEKIIRVSKPDLKIFIGESITGNDCIEQARMFNSLVEMDGIILTKADVDEKGGAPLSISYVINKPILFLGVGQSYDDLEEFSAQKILKNLGFE